MSNNNYNQETETVQQNISDYINNNDQTQRQSHIDLSSVCYGYHLPRNYVNKKKGDLASNIMSMIKAKENLLKFLNISDFKSREIHTCHLCKNDSGSKDFVCINPLHLYFGTASENSFDIDPEVRKKCGRIGGSKGGRIGGKIGGKNAAGKGVKIAIDNGTHINQTISTCPHCQKSGKGRSMYRWHFENCKYNHQNIVKAS